MSDYGSTKKVNEVVYWDDINIQSYDEHKPQRNGSYYK